MDWSQIVSLVFQGVLMVLTGVLAFTTIALWRSTNRYTEATKQMAHSTEVMSKISNRQSATQIIQTLFGSIQSAPDELREEIERDYPHFRDNLRRFAWRCSNNIDRLFEDAFNFDEDDFDSGINPQCRQVGDNDHGH